ncbi:MAG: 8-amino-7-oxononanoate synthase, partial [Marinirhabdus sp.]
YLFNFGRSFIYTTGLPPHAIATVIAAYGQLAGAASTIGLLHNNISKLRYEIERNGLKDRFPKSGSAIHACLVPTNDRVKKVALQLQREGYGVKPVLSPTVPMGQERLRICVHSFNSGNEIERLCKLLCGFI